MLYSEFNIGGVFHCGSKRWLCTDKGTRVIVAVCLTVCRYNDNGHGIPQCMRDKVLEVDPGWVIGPPYALQEHVFDEHDMEGCEQP